MRSRGRRCSRSTAARGRRADHARCPFRHARSRRGPAQRQSGAGAAGRRTARQRTSPKSASPPSPTAGRCTRTPLEAGNLVVTIGDVRRDGIAHAIERAFDHVAHCDALVDRLRHRRHRPLAIPGGARRAARRDGSPRLLRRGSAPRARPARPRHRPGRMGSATGPKRPQRFDCRPLGRRVPCRLRDALSS